MLIVGKDNIPKKWLKYFELIHNEDCSVKMLDEQSGVSISKIGNPRGTHKKGLFANSEFNKVGREHNDKGGASRFFYCAKASKSERNYGCEELEEKEQQGQVNASKCTKCGKYYQAGDGRELCNCEEPKFKHPINKNNHPTVKPIKLLEYLIKLVSKENAIVLDPFLGSGTTAIACIKLNRKFIGIEKEEEYVKIAKARIKPFLKLKDDKIIQTKDSR